MPHSRTLLIPGLLCLFGCATAEEGQRPPQGQGGNAFQQIDRNGDGRISSDEVAASGQNALGSHFDLLDQDGDGTVDRQEFSAFESLRRPAAPPPSAAAPQSERPQPRGLPMEMNSLPARWKNAI